MDREWTMENSFHRIVSQTMRLYFARNYQVMERLDVHPGQVPVLFEIHRKGGLYQKELCDSLCLRASTVTVMLQRMTKNGLVERRQDEADQRRTRIFLTEKGRPPSGICVTPLKRWRRSALRAFLWRNSAAQALCHANPG